MAKRRIETQYRGLLKQARALHDARYEVDRPKPRAAQQQSEETGLEKAVGYLWIAWFVLAFAGAIISLPHTLGTVLSTLGIGALSIQDAGSLIYAGAVFVGVELALISVALVSELSRSEKDLERVGKQASLAGLVNGLIQRIGLRPPFDLSHLPDKQPSTGLGLVALLFAASLTFNLVDALFAELPPQAAGVMATLASYQDEVLLASRAMAGILGPALLLIAGHRFAQEVVRAGTKRQRADLAQQKALEEWEAQRDQSWQDSGEEWINQLMDTSASDKLQETLGAQSQEAEPDPFYPGSPQPVSSNGNGHKAPQGS